MSDCKCQQPCSPCNNNCPDDGEILPAAILDPEDCNTSCCWKSCKDNCWVNIQSTNDCLTVDTSECGVIKLTAECPKPTYVTAWDNVTIDEVTPPDECYMDGGDCWIEGWWRVNASDEKVKACGGDTTPGYLNQKLDAWSWIVIDEVWCWWGNAYLRIGIKEGTIPECPDVPDLVVNYDWDLLNISQSWDHRHIVNISDNKKGSFFDNAVMLWFVHNKTYAPIQLNDDWNAEHIVFVESGDWAWQWWWNMYTGNSALATANWIKIKQSGYYYIYWQVTVVNNWTDANFYLNLGRALLKLKRGDNEYLVATAKHWAYWTFIAAKWWKGINVDQDWTISLTRWTVNISSDWWTYEVSFENWSWIQPTKWFDWPWATLNMWVYLDLREWDVLTVWYRPQSDIPSSPWKACSFRLVWQDDSTPEWFENKIVFWGTTIGIHPITPTVFMDNSLRNIIQ